MGTQRSKFNWSCLDRNSIAEFLWAFYPEVCNKEFPVAKFHNTIAGYIKKYLPVKIRRSNSEKVDFGWVYVGGSYYSDLDKEKQKCIEIILVYNTFEDTINLTPKRYHRMCYSIADTLLHEIMHMRQYRRRKFKDLPDYASTAEKDEQHREQSYLGNSDEIDAYSFNIACELLIKFKDDTKKVIDYLNEDQKGLRRRHNGWRMYLKAFDYDHNHPIIKRTKKKVIKYIPRALVGKPYRNSDWIGR